MKKIQKLAIMCLVAAFGAAGAATVQGAGAPAAGAAGAAGAGAAMAGRVGGRVTADGQVDQMKAMEKTLEQTLIEEGKAKEKADKETSIKGVSQPVVRGTSAPAVSFGALGWKVGKLEVSRGPKDSDRFAGGFAEAAAKKVSARDAEALTKALEDHFRTNGYYLCSVQPVATNETGKTVDYKVNYGHIRNVMVRFKEQSWLTKQTEGGDGRADGRWFSKEQIRYRYLSQVASSNVFNYNMLYDKFYQMNAHPDLTALISLSVPQGADYPADDDRALDVDVEVLERMPLHFVLDVDNNGTDASENWMGRLTAQYLNLTKHDDVLTFNYQNSLQDIEALGGLAGSYYLPHRFGTMHDFGATLYGGWTDVDSEDVVPGIDVVGSGWFAGFQESATLVEADARSLRLSLGFVRRYVKDHLEVTSDEGHYRLEANEVTVMPFSVAVMYSDKKPDALYGLNFATVEALYNFGDFLGTSDDEEMELQRTGASPDYMILRGQLARLQMLPLGGRTTGVPMLFAKVSGQWADGPLIPAEEMGLGGAGSVRGYATREYLGDHGVAGTLELRSPIALGFFTRKIPAWCGQTTTAAKAAAAATEDPADRLQLVLFADAGYIKIDEPLPGEEEDKTLYSVGVGGRLAVSEHFQVSCDVGFPLEETTDSDDACVHFSAQVQF